MAETASTVHITVWDKGGDALDQLGDIPPMGMAMGGGNESGMQHMAQMQQMMQMMQQMQGQMQTMQGQMTQMQSQMARGPAQARRTHR